jgi:hypothetical protein
VYSYSLVESIVSRLPSQKRLPDSIPTNARGTRILRDGHTCLVPGAGEALYTNVEIDMEMP